MMRIKSPEVFGPNVMRVSWFMVSPSMAGEANVSPRVEGPHSAAEIRLLGTNASRSFFTNRIGARSPSPKREYVVLFCRAHLYRVSGWTLK